MGTRSVEVLRNVGAPGPGRPRRPSSGRPGRARLLAAVAVAGLALAPPAPAQTPTEPQPPDSTATPRTPQDPGLPGHPTFREILDLRTAYQANISPDGAHVAFTLSVPDWDQDRYVRELWVASGGGPPVRVATEADGFGFAAQWTPDSHWLVYRVGGSEPSLAFRSPDGWNRRSVPLPVAGAGTVRISPDGARVAVLAREPRGHRDRREQELYGPFRVRDDNRRMTHLWVAPLGGSEEPRQLTSGDFTVTDASWSPDGGRIAYVHQRDPGRNSWWTADLSVVELATGQSRPLATQPGPDRNPMWSPDGSRVAFLSTLADSITNLPLEMAVVPAEGGEMRVLTDDLATAPTPVAWTDEGIFLAALDGVERHLYRLDPDRASLTRLSEPPFLIREVSVTPDGRSVAFTAQSADGLREVYRSSTESFEPRALTSLTDQVEGWDVGTREVISWTGPGGVPIEGILHKPTDYDPSRRYPLLLIVHGGPRAVSSPALTLSSSGVYPVTHFLRKGALVLQPNYRGGTGYGGEFRQLHGPGVGWGDAGDVDAGAQHLVDEGLADPDRIGLMGWSYGGFISAYLTATSDRFAAISVGAGISDWATHYAWETGSWTTRFYSFDGLRPEEDPERWAQASPMTHIAGASTPTLIQHVDGDPVVTILNAYELQHALEDLGVPNRFVIYPGSGHGVGALKQRLGGLWHNWQWFLRYVWDEEVDLPIPAPAPPPT